MKMAGAFTPAIRVILDTNYADLRRLLEHIGQGCPVAFAF